MREQTGVKADVSDGQQCLSSC